LRVFGISRPGVGTPVKTRPDPDSGSPDDVAEARSAMSRGKVEGEQGSLSEPADSVLMAGAV